MGPYVVNVFTDGEDGTHIVFSRDVAPGAGFEDVDPAAFHGMDQAGDPTIGVELIEVDGDTVIVRMSAMGAVPGFVSVPGAITFIHTASVAGSVDGEQALGCVNRRAFATILSVTLDPDTERGVLVNWDRPATLNDITLLSIDDGDEGHLAENLDSGNGTAQWHVDMEGSFEPQTGYVWTAQATFATDADGNTSNPGTGFVLPAPS